VPDGALTDKPLVAPYRADRVKMVDSVCPYCGVGCAVRYHVDRDIDRIVRVTGRPEAGRTRADSA